MNFFEHQDRARAVSRRLFALYAITLVAVLIALNAVTIAIVIAANDGRLDEGGRAQAATQDVGLIASTALITTLAAGAIIGIATAIKLSQLGGDGAKVAELLGGRPIVGQPTDLSERKLVNVVEEMSIASGVPMPRLYLLDDEAGINAFAAGTRAETATIGVTRGAIDRLTRDELQGVIAHEVSHILNGDMRVNLRLIGLNFGLIAIGFIGLQTLRHAPRFMSGSGRSSRNSKNAGGALGIVAAILIIALAMMVVGYIGTLAGKILQAAVSRQREYLADASAVQFTRNPRGIGGALRKIGGLGAGSQLQAPNAAEASHLFFSAGVAGLLDSLFATHPPLEKRIAAVDPTLLTEPMPTAAVPPPLPTSATGFAGRTAKPRQAVSPTHLVDVDRGVTQQQFEAAGRFVEAFPAGAVDLASEPYGARAIAVGLLLDADPAMRSNQLRRVAAVDEPLARLVLRSLPMFDAIEVDQRLPLLERALPSLRLLSPTQFAHFRTLCQTLAESDATFSPFEVALLAILDVELGVLSRDGNVKAPASLTAAARPIGVVLSSLAIAGGTPQATVAFDRAVERLELPSGAVALAGQYEPGELRAALATLRGSPLGVRRRVIDAAAHCVTLDGTVGPHELELMRAVSAALGVSIPPLFDAA